MIYHISPTIGTNCGIAAFADKLNKSLNIITKSKKVQLYSISY